jgi:tetratricopeptide (TPR) repeat protein
VPARRRPVGPILLIVGPPESRILILRIVRDATAMTVRQPPHFESASPAPPLAATSLLERRPTNDMRLMSRTHVFVLASLAACATTALDGTATLVAATIPWQQTIAPSGSEGVLGFDAANCGSAYFGSDLSTGRTSGTANPLDSEDRNKLSVAFRGQTVDGEAPTTYRLPQVPSPPSAPVRIAGRNRPLFSPPLPAPEFAPPRADPAANSRIAPREAITPLPGGRTFDFERGPARSPADENVGIAPEAMEPPPLSAPADQTSQEQALTGPVPGESIPATPTTSDLAVQLLPAVQRGYVLAQRGALFAARTEFVQVLRRVAQAKDVTAASEEHSQALAAGMRALDEADDFIPEGLEYEANLDVRVTASSHRTPALSAWEDDVLPHEAVILYHAFAREQLARAVAGEQAGSMALYGLGRIDAQRAERKDDDVRHVRGAMTMYSAALAACPHNHLAANELGVLECRTGKPDEAVRLFQRAIDFAPSATAYHNLSIAQHKLGQHVQARANEQESQRLASLERAGGVISQRAGVQWVSPDEISRVTQPGGLTPSPLHSADVQPAPAKSAWQRTLDLSKSLPGRGSAAAPTARVARPVASPQQPQWR